MILEISKEEFEEKFPKSNYEWIPFEMFLSFFSGDHRTRLFRTIERAMDSLEANVDEKEADYYALYHRGQKITFIGLIADCGDRVFYWFQKRGEI